jgi:hypothetical protein
VAFLALCACSMQALDANREARQLTADCPPRQKTSSGAPEAAGGARSLSGRLPRNASRVVADVLHQSARDPSPDGGSLLTIAILASADQVLGQSNLAPPGSTVEVFSCGALPADLTGKRIEAIMSLVGDAQGTRWWIWNVRTLP